MKIIIFSWPLSCLLWAAKVSILDANAQKSGEKPGVKSAGAMPLICIHLLTPEYLERIRGHMFSLNERDRYMRFGYQPTDQQIGDYVDRIDFARDEVFGAFDKDEQLIGIAHLAYDIAPGANNKQQSHMAEFGVSVNAVTRGMGIGGSLFVHSAQSVASKGIDQMYIHTINRNIPMIKIIKRSGAEIFRDVGDVDAYLAMPANNAWLRMRAMDDHEAMQADYGIKVGLGMFKDDAK